MVPANFKIQYDEDAIAGAIAKLGREIDTWARDVRAMTSSDLLTIPVLRGGIFFFADLVRHIKHSVEIAPVSAWSYETGENVQRDSVSVDAGKLAVEGRSVLVVDDVCDSGRTLAELTAYFTKLGAREVRSAVLIKRILPHQTFSPDWIGFEYTGPEWFVGYGMDDCDRWRNLGSIYIIQK
ncbi:MAG: hypothetical protein RL417_1048 [Pseudomonadota bacterium]|jgi:hypoxanthine phosphoribosyltransferase